jgi:hypothetical protein
VINPFLPLIDAGVCVQTGSGQEMRPQQWYLEARVMSYVPSLVSLGSTTDGFVASCSRDFNCKLNVVSECVFCPRTGCCEW